MRSRSVLTRAIAGVVTTVVVLAGAACSSNDTTTASSTAQAGSGASQSGSGASQSAAPAPTGTPITIGVVATETGDLAGPYEGIRGVADAWAQWVNETQGGISGHPVKVITADDQSLPANATSAVRKMVEEDGAVAIFLGSAVGSTVTADYLAEKGIPQIAADQGQRAPDAPTSWFTTDLGMPAVAQSGAVVAKDAGANSVIAAVCSEVAACAGIGDLMSSYAPTVGVEYKGIVTIAGSDTSATAQCLQIVDSGTQAVAAFIGVNAALKIIETCQGQGYEGQYVQFSWADKVISQLPGTQYGVLYSFPWWSDAAPVAEYRDVMAQYSPDTDYKASGSGLLWEQLSLFQKAMDTSGPAASATVAGTDVISAFYTVKDETLDGLLPQPITFSESGNTPITCFWPVKREEDGTYSTLSGSWTAGNGATGDLASQCLS